MRPAVGFGVRSGEEQERLALLCRLQLDIAPDRPGNVIHLEITEQTAGSVLARAGCIHRYPTETGGEELGPAMVTAELAALLARRGRLQGLAEHEPRGNPQRAT